MELNRMMGASHSASLFSGAGQDYLKLKKKDRTLFDMSLFASANQIMTKSKYFQSTEVFSISIKWFPTLKFKDIVLLPKKKRNDEG